jgi:pimeloyl-ACP methyl ester carboxylesterase
VSAALDLAPFHAEYPWDGRLLGLRGGVHLHYLDEGRGEPLLMLHGNPTWSFYYRNLVKALAPDFRCVVPDHVGCGRSDVPPESAYDYVLERRAEDVECLMNTLGLEGVTLVLHDWGGMIGLAAALRRPERIRRLVILNTAGFGLPPGRRLAWPIALARDLPLSTLLVRGANAFVRGAALTCTTRPLPRTVRDAYLAPHRTWADRISVDRFVKDIPLRPGDRSQAIVDEVSSRLGELAHLPALVLWGRRDYVFDDAFLAEWRRRLPVAEVHAFDDAGHWVLEDAHERIVPLLRDFLGRTP